MSQNTETSAEPSPTIGELFTFFVLAYLFSWWPFAIGLPVLLAHGPTIVAVAIVLISADRNLRSGFWRRLATFNAGWWYIIGPAVIVAYHAFAFVILTAAGAPMSHAPTLTLSTALLLLAIGGQWEEFGWTGYALPRLQQKFAMQRYPLFTAAIVLGALRAIWHLPLVLSGAIFWFDMLFLAMAMQLIISWIYARSGGSVPAVFVFHYVSNIAGAMMGSVYEGPYRLAYYVAFISGASVIALVVTLLPIKRGAHIHRRA